MSLETHNIVKNIHLLFLRTKSQAARHVLREQIIYVNISFVCFKILTQTRVPLECVFLTCCVHPKNRYLRKWLLSNR